MDERVYGVFNPVATWPAAAMFFVAFLICTVGFHVEASVLGPENRIPDARGWYTPPEVRDLFDRLGEHGRTVYAATAMSLDVVFPIAYGGMFAALIGNVYRPRTARLLVGVPVLAMAADLVENCLLSYYAWNFDGKQWPLLIWGAATATALKFVFIVLSMILTAAGGLIAIATEPTE
jgi:hypothetical protein